MLNNSVNRKNTWHHFFCSPCMSQAYWSPQSSAPQRASTNLQLKVLLPMLLFTTLCTLHIHCCNAGPDETFGGSFLHATFTKFRHHVVCWVSRTVPAIRACLLDNVAKMLGTLSARIDSGQHIHLQAVFVSGTCLCTLCEAAG